MAGDVNTPVKTGNATPVESPVEVGMDSGGEWQQEHSTTKAPEHNINQGNDQGGYGHNPGY